MRAVDAYAAGYTGLGVTVGVVDSGLFSAHPEFADGRVRPLTITGTFGSNGYYFTDSSGAPDDLSPQPSFFDKGDAYTVPGTYDPAFNDPHGTHVSGSIAAARNGVGMHGVAFDATVYVANTHTTDEGNYGANADYAYFKNAYGSLAAAGARAINSSWGSPPPTDNYNSLPGLRQAYTKFDGQLGYIDALSDVAKQYDIIQVFAAGNTGWDNPNVRSSLPYFRPDIEKNWLAVGAADQGINGSTAPEDVILAGYSNRAGAAKYWYVVAPGENINSTAPTYTPDAVWDPYGWGIDPNHQTGYTTIGGTSMAAPHATGALAVIMQRYPYLTNTQARDVLLTTAYHRNAVDGVPDANPNAPNAVWGWGLVDLAKAMRGPGQFPGPVAANLPAGTQDTWSNDISEDALIQRKQENDAETAAWATRRAALEPRIHTPVLTAGLPASRTALDGVVSALRSGSPSAILNAVRAANDDPVANQVLATFVRSNGYDGRWPLTDPAYGPDRTNAGNSLNSYLSGLTSADYRRTIAFIVQDWQAETRIETTRIASFAGMSIQGSLIKLGPGTLTLSGTNSFSGGVTFAGGVLSVALDASLGAAGSPLTFDGGTLQITGTAFTTTTRPITWGQNGGGLDIADPANTVTLAQSLAGPGGLTKLGTGTLALSGSNAYAGPTTIAAGTLLARGGQAIGDLSAVTVASGATLALADSETIGSLAGQGRVALGAARLTAGGDGTSTTFAGTLDGTGGLTKAGAGTLTLTAAHGFTGPAILAAGGLSLTATASLAAPVVTLAGTRLTNAGTLAGGLANAGTTITSGTITGGLINIGTVLASAGRIDGAIRNDAGTIAVTGTVAGDGTLANAAGATLSVTGAYSLTGLLTNTGTVTVAGGGRFLAGGVANAGLLTVAQNGSVIDDLLNTGRLVNAGSYTADAVNAAGATLVNTGTFTTVSAPFANAGTLISSGTLTGGLANTGVAQVSGVLAGGVGNAVGATIALAGPTSGIGRLTNDGSFDLGRTDLAIGSLAGSTPEAVLGNGQLTVGSDGASTHYAGRIVDGGTQTGLTKVGPGTLTLSGLSPLSGPVRVLDGELAVTGGLPNAALAIGPGSLLTGEAQLGSLSLGSGATLAPGIGAGALGRISVAGNLVLAPGALYRVDATADGRADRIDVGGSATVAGATVQAIAGTGQYAPRTRYTILTAAGGVQGRFAGVSSNFAFLTPFLAYAPEAVTLTLARNDLDFAAVAWMRNQRASAAAAQAGAVGSPLYDAVAMLSAPQARAAFAALSGDGHATLASTVFANAGLLREAVLDRLRWDMAQAARPGDGSEPAVSLWGQGLGSVGQVRTDGNAAGLSRHSAGFLLGLDARVDTPLGGLRMGAVGGSLETGFASPAQVQTGALTSTFGGVYGSLQAGSALLRFGALAADDPAQLRRVVAFPGLSDSATARLGGHSVQGFGEAGYRIGLSEAVELEPFAGGAVVSVTRERFEERGGAATLAGFGHEHTVPSATIGLRMQAQLDRDAPAPAFVHGMVAYRRSFGDLVPKVPLAFRGTGARFANRGLPLDRDVLVSEVGLGLMLAPGLSAGLSYTGQIGARAQDHAAKGSLVYKF